MANLPNKKYDIIYADPPWSYDDKALAGNRGACCKYPVQGTNWIEDLPVANIAKSNCLLFLWVTMPKLNECWDVIKKWGFEYKTVAFTWVKRNKNAGSWFMGMGSWTRANAELCLLATRGNPCRVNAGVSSVIDTPVMEHSRKPAIVRERIVELVGDISRIELFARKPKDQLFDARGFDGWDVWGNEAGDIVLDGEDVRIVERKGA